MDTVEAQLECTQQLARAGNRFTGRRTASAARGIGLAGQDGKNNGGARASITGQSEP
jgi:hypothetical protein